MVDAPQWVFKVQDDYGSVTVTISCNGALVGHMTLSPNDWYALRETLLQGVKHVQQDWWRGTIRFSKGVTRPVANGIGV